MDISQRKKSLHCTIVSENENVEAIEIGMDRQNLCFSKIGNILGFFSTFVPHRFQVKNVKKFSMISFQNLDPGFFSVVIILQNTAIPYIPVETCFQWHES